MVYKNYVVFWKIATWKFIIRKYKKVLKNVNIFLDIYLEFWKFLHNNRKNQPLQREAKIAQTLPLIKWSIRPSLLDDVVYGWSLSMWVYYPYTAFHIMRRKVELECNGTSVLLTCTGLSKTKCTFPLYDFIIIECTLKRGKG